MISMKSVTAKLFLAAGVSAILAVGAVTPSSAASTTKRLNPARTYNAYNAFASDPLPSRGLPRSLRQGPDPGYFAHGAPDSPPGSAYQSFGNNQDMGLVR